MLSKHEHNPTREANLKKRGEKLLTGFIGTNEDIAEAYIYLARAKYTTGTRTLISVSPLYAPLIYLIVTVVDGGSLLG